MQFEAQQADLEKNLVFETLWVAQSMSWSIEYTLELGIDAYNNTVAFLKEQKEEMEKSMETGKIPQIKTLGR